MKAFGRWNTEIEPNNTPDYKEDRISVQNRSRSKYKDHSKSSSRSRRKKRSKESDIQKFSIKVPIEKRQFNTEQNSRPPSRGRTFKISSRAGSRTPNPSKLQNFHKERTRSQIEFESEGRNDVNHDLPLPVRLSTESPPISKKSYNVTKGADLSKSFKSSNTDQDSRRKRDTFEDDHFLHCINLKKILLSKKSHAFSRRGRGLSQSLPSKSIRSNEEESRIFTLGGNRVLEKVDEQIDCKELLPIKRKQPYSLLESISSRNELFLKVDAKSKPKNIMIVQNHPNSQYCIKPKKIDLTLAKKMLLFSDDIYDKTIFEEFLVEICLFRKAISTNRYLVTRNIKKQSIKLKNIEKGCIHYNLREATSIS